MKRVKLEIDPLVYEFYKKIGENVGLKPEQVMADALFKLAGDLAQQVRGKEPFFKVN